MEWFKKKVRWFLNTLEEADSIDPWRGNHAEVPGGIRLFDLVALHLEDLGYYPRIYRSGNMLVIYKTRWARFIDKRVGAIAFEIGGPWPYRSERPVHIWSFGFGQPYALHAGSSTMSRDRIVNVCDVSDPFAIEKITEVVNGFYQIRH